MREIAAVFIDGSPGIELRWTQVTYDQGMRRFGLLATEQDLLSGAMRPDLDTVMADLRLLVTEPHHAPAGPATRTWLRSL